MVQKPHHPQPCWPYCNPKITYCPPALRRAASPLSAPIREISDANPPAWTLLMVKRPACGNVRALEHLRARPQVTALSHLGPGGLDVLLCPSRLLFIPPLRGCQRRARLALQGSHHTELIRIPKHRPLLPALLQMGETEAWRDDGADSDRLL